MTEKNTLVASKKRKPLRSRWALGMYICAAVSLIVAGFMVYYSIAYVLDYYESYGMSISEGMKDVIQYVISSSGSYIGFAVVFAAAGGIFSKLEALSHVEENRVLHEDAKTREDAEAAGDKGQQPEPEEADENETDEKDTAEDADDAEMQESETEKENEK